MNKAQQILKEIKKLEQELLNEVHAQEVQFAYKVEQKKVYFEGATQKLHASQASNVFRYLWNAPLLNILTFPITWFGIIPAFLMDISVTTYQAICFKVYGIPKVKRSDYIVIDRQNLHYLNIIERLNCMYCGYFTGLIAYTQEVAARTEQYWCPIKHASKPQVMHAHYPKFLEYGDAQAYLDQLDNIRKDYDEH